MNKQLILAALTISLSMPAQADDLQYVTAGYNHVERSIGLATVRKITFENGNVVVLTTDGAVTFPITQMEKLFFSSTPTAIRDLKDRSKSLAYVNGVVKAQGTGVLRVYGISGNLQRVANVRGTANVSLESLPQGVYIIQMGSETIKIQK